MAIDATHSDVFVRRDGHYLLDQPSDETRALETAYDEWDARVTSRMPLPRIGWGWYTPFTRYGTPVLMATAGYLFATGVLHWPIWAGVLVAVVLGLIGIPFGKSTAHDERSSAERERLQRAIRLAGPMPPAPAATWVPDTVLRAAPADASSAQLRAWAEVVGGYETRTAQLPQIRREWRVSRPNGPMGYTPGPDDILAFERDLRSRRPSYEAAMTELGLTPQPVPHGLA